MFTRRLIAFRKAQPVLQRRNFFQGRALRGAGVKDIVWLDPSGQRDDRRCVERARGAIRSACCSPEMPSTKWMRAASGWPATPCSSSTMPPPTPPRSCSPQTARRRRRNGSHRWTTAFETAVPDNPPRTLAAGDRFDLPGHAMGRSSCGAHSATAWRMMTRPALVQGRDHLRAARPGVLRQHRRRHRRLPRADPRSSTTCRTSASTRSGSCRSIRRRCGTTATTSPNYQSVHPTYGTLRRLQGVPARGARARAARHHRAGHQPHVGPASVVSGGAPRAAGTRPSATSTSGATRTEKYQDARIIFTDTETSNWTWDPTAEGVLLAPLLSPPARPELRQPARRAGGARRRCGSGSTWAWTACGSTRSRT